MIHEDGPIAVAVERDAHGQPALDHGPRKFVGMGRSTAQIDVPAIGMIADHDGLKAQAFEERRRDRRRRAVRAIDREAESTS